MDLSEDLMKRIENLPFEIRQRCCKKLGDGKYKVKVIQVKVVPSLVVSIYEKIAKEGLKDESSVARKAIMEYLKKEL